MRRLTWLLALRKQLLLAWAIVRHPQVSAGPKILVILAALYVLSPIDLVSDVIPVLGWLDDGVIAFALLKLATQWLPPALARELEMYARHKHKRIGELPAVHSA